MKPKEAMVSKEELYNLYWHEGMSMREIGRNLDVSARTIYNWMRWYGIDSRTDSESLLIETKKPSKKELEEMYLGKKMSATEIGREIGVTHATVLKWMNQCIIKTRSNSESKLNGIFAGKRNGNWQGGLSGGKYCYKFNNIFKESVRERDDYTCQLCAYEQKLDGKRLSIHHIHYDKENCYPDVIALCESCNPKVNANREYWEEFFMNELAEREMLNWSK